jgi:hypothetical protein
MAIKIVLAVVIVVAALALFIATRPAEFRIARSLTMAAPASAAFAQVNDFRSWDAWSPWSKIDPAMAVTYGGAETGEGATYAWSGNREIGEGRMTIEESRPHERIRLRLEFLKPMKATNTGEFTFEPEGAGTRVTWSMSGTNSFMGKAIGLVMNMDRMVGEQFEKGLADMKAIVEAD